MTEAVNIIKNPDFDEWDGSSFLSWYGFGWCELRRGTKCQGKKSCEAINRKHVYSGMAQDLTDSLELGNRYEFSSLVKLSPTANEDRSEVVRLQFQYKLSDQSEICYLKIAEKNLNAMDWQKLCGTISLPHAGPDCRLESAILHFGSPCVETNFMVACTNLTLVPKVTDVSTNLIRNPNFEVTENHVPVFWEPFGNVKFKAGVLLHNGTASCQTYQRHALWSGVGQNLLYEVKLGHRYKFSAVVRLTDDNESSEKHRICCTLKLKLQNEKDERYQLFALVDNVTSADWSELKGQLNMPLGADSSLLETAFIYFDGPPHDVNFVIASVCLHDVTPPGVRQRLEANEIMRKNTTKSCTDTLKPAESYPVVYLSYHQSAQNRVEEMKKRLVHAGVRVIDVHRTRTGQDLTGAIGDGIEKAKVVISCVTGKHCTDEIHQGEITLAHLQQVPICPVLLEPMSWPPKCSVMKIYEKLCFLDFATQHNITQEMLERLLAGIKSA